jgi:predicted acetyltransferase
MKYQTCNIEKFLFNGKYELPAMIIPVNIQFLYNSAIILSELDFAINTVFVINNHKLKIVNKAIHINDYKYICNYI